MRRGKASSAIERAETSISEALSSTDKLVGREHVLANGAVVRLDLGKGETTPWLLSTQSSDGLSAVWPLEADRADSRAAGLEALEMIADMTLNPPVVTPEDERRPAIIDDGSGELRLRMPCHSDDGECPGYEVVVNCGDESFYRRATELANAPASKRVTELSATIKRLRELDLRNSLALPAKKLERSECVGCESAEIRAGVLEPEDGEFWYDTEQSEWMLAMALESQTEDSAVMSAPTGVRDYFIDFEELEEIATGLGRTDDDSSV